MARIEVRNVASRATEHEIQNLFSSTGFIIKVEMRRDNPWSQVAYVTFRDAEAAEAAVVLSGAKIMDQPVNVIRTMDHALDGQDSALNYYGSLNPMPPQVLHNASSTNIPPPHMGNDNKGMIDEGPKTLVSQDSDATLGQANPSWVYADKSSNNNSIEINIGLDDNTNTISNTTPVLQWNGGGSGGRTKTVLCMAQGVGQALVKSRYITNAGSWVSGAFSHVAKVATHITTKDKRELSTGLRAQA